MGIRLSREHGVAPIIQNCFFCNESKGLLLAGAQANKIAQSAGHDSYHSMGSQGLVTDHEPCDKCKGYMQQGIILIGVDEAKSTDMQNPWRTGRFAVVKDRAIKELVNPPELAESILKKRMCFMPDEVFVALGIPETMEESEDE